MALNILSDNKVVPFVSEAASLTTSSLYPTLSRSDERDLMFETSSFIATEMKSHGAVDEQPASGEEAPSRLQRRAVVQQVSLSSTLPRGHVTSESAPDGSSLSTTSHTSDIPLAPIEGRPVNFGLVVPGVYRSSYPKKEDFAFLKGLKLKTIVTLVKKDEPDHELEAFVAANGIQQVIFNMKGTKKEPIPPSTMAAILEIVLDRQNYPLVIHCNHGKHRTGCVVAVVRKLSGWNLERTLDEYKSYATPKVRECDVDYITAFQPSSLEMIRIRPARGEHGRFSPLQVRSFIRTLMFTVVVTSIWLFSGSRMVVPHSNPPS
ncbi:Tyrosine-protein phosphatase SIW14 [Trichoderma ghanense]|uniref:diphosphoinositol-polyphosphate diphosphatase n=1 Tax=Trichoderma ghanense TaxID=65468 RepID=A0ABY2GPF8_9HYPO